jgi:hypothetical protein
MPSDLCKRLSVLCAFVWLCAATVEAQTGSVTARGTVSKIVALSIEPNSTSSDVDVDVVSIGRTVRMTLSGDGPNSSVIRVPLVVRSNSDFRIWAGVESNTAELIQLSATDVRAGGGFVSPEAVNNLELPKHRNLEGVQGPFVIASGPRVSLSGTLQSLNNALQITLRCHVKPKSDGAWVVHLTFFND